MNKAHETHDLFTHKDFIGDEKKSKLGRMVILGDLKACRKCDGFGDDLEGLCQKSEFYQILKSGSSDMDFAIQIADLQKTKASLINLLVEITHHDGALKECEDQWLPIVQKELESRSK